MMKKALIIIAVLMLVIFNSVFAADIALSSDPKTAKIFSSLKVNDALKAEAVFTVDTSKEALLSKESLKIVFNEVCGHVKSYVFQIKDVCTETIPIYEKIIDNKTEPKIIGYEDISYDCYKEFSTINPEIKDYRIKADIESALCSDGFMGYRIDWIPSITINEVEYVKDDWAWWNATGGSIYYDGLYTVHTFTANGTFVWVNDTQNVSVLVVAGGGGGGNLGGGGGGAGGLIYYGANYTISAGNYDVVVGLGGRYGNSTYPRGFNGTNSSFGNLSALGGGGGAGNDLTPGSDGGSGGGSAAALAAAYGSGLAGQGYDGGGAGAGSPYPSGGGGGAGGLGGTGATTYPGDGGIGREIGINGSTVCYAGGGGAGGRTGASDGGSATCGGGAGGLGAEKGFYATNGTGGGGGGGGFHPTTGYDGGSGGSGIVIIRYETYVVADSEVPVVNLSYPADGNITNSSIIDFGFLVVDETAENLSCNLLINSSYYGGVVALNNTVANVQNNVSLSVGTYFWSVVCSDGYNDGFSDNRSLYVVDCWEDWVAEYDSCKINDTRIKTYSDSNTCGSTYFLPDDNNTEVACNYCSQNIISNETECISGWLTKNYIDLNYSTCCDVTGIESDCDILVPPFSETTREACVPPVGNATPCDDYNLTLDFVCRYDPEPLLKDKMNIVCIIPDNDSYQCVVNVFQDNNLLATTPEYKEATDSLINLKPQTDTRTYFTPSERLLNAFYTSKSIVTDTPFVVEVLCTSMTSDIVSQVCVTPEYEGQTWVLGRTKWASDNFSLLFWIIICAFILAGIIFYIVKVARSGY